MKTEAHILYVLILILLSCNHPKENAEEIVNQWLQKEIKFPASINNTKQDSIWQLMLNKDFKLLTIIDTNSCTECRLRFYDWEKYIKDADSTNSNLAFLFIIHAKNYSIVDTMRKKNKFTYPIYDYENKVGKLNKFPSNPLFQTFLLDKDNKVILLGSPINNYHMWNLYKEIFTKK